jgi:murein DD-endopeptidase MepM/ murein hydrolase activator NlpD
MNIIVVSDHRSAPRSFTLGIWHVALAALLGLAGLAGLVLGAATLLQDQAPRASLAARTNLPAVTDVGPTLNMMAGKLGEMEAQLLRLDAFSDRLSTLTGTHAAGRRATAQPTEEAAPVDPPASAAQQPHAAVQTLDRLRQELASMAARIEQRSSRLDRLETRVVDARAEARTLPTTAPIIESYQSSDYGARSDPFNGEEKFHRGIDFVAPSGTAFTAAATGVVASVRAAPDYGNVIEIDHGNGLTTRYAHASRVEVREGDVVIKGQRIGQVGSTGHSTGPHLHFEVRDHGRTLNPEKFLRLAS